MLSDLKDVFRSEFLNSLVMNFVCCPTYVNLAHFVIVLTSLYVFVSVVRLILFKIFPLYFFYYVLLALLCHTVFCYLFHLWGMLKDDWPSI